LAAVFVATFIYMPLLVGAVSYPFWYSFALQIGEIDHSFYEVSAQINPVLLLAILVDVRRCRSLESQDLLGTIVALIGGEIVALYGAAGAPIGRPGYATVSASLTGSTPRNVVSDLAALRSGEFAMSPRTRNITALP
jgi:hypothetical protein